MPIEIRVPALGESIVDAVIARWLKKEGEAVQKDDPLVELETDKVNVEVPAPQSGVLQKISRQEGDTVAVGEAIGLLGEGAGTTQAPAQAPAPTKEAGPAPSQPAQAAQPAASPVETPTAPPQVAAQPGNGVVTATPVARRVAAEHHVDLAQVKGRNPQGRVTKEDVLTYLDR